MKAIVLGSTGAVGRALVHELISNSDYEEVRAITRRQYDFGIESHKLVTKVVDFASLEKHKSDLQGCDAVFVAMGTTAAAAGENFVKIDQDLTVETTRATLTTGTQQHVLYVSSFGASESARLLYPRSKGQTERRLRELGANKTTIFRPAFLELQQERETPRMAERLLLPIMSRLRYVGIKSMSANVAEVAKAMRIVAENKVKTVSLSDPVTNSNILALCSE